MKTLTALAALIMAVPLATQAQAQSQAPGPGKFFAATDRNSDGVLTKAEWQAAGRNPMGFQMMDMNSDGKVTRAEADAAMAKVMERRAQQTN